MAETTNENVEFYRGLDQDLQNALKQDGAFYYTTDTHKLYSSDGSEFYPVGGANVVTTSIVLNSDAWQNSTSGVGYTITIDAEDNENLANVEITAEDNPIVDIVLPNDGTPDSNLALLTEWAKIHNIVTDQGSITAYAYGEKPSENLTIQLMVVR